MALTLPPNTLALDIRALDALKQGAGSSAQAAQTTREAARQFESLFMHELVKSMRAATLKSGLMDSGQADLGQDLLDQQLALSLSGMPGGLSEAIRRQLARQMAGAAGDARGDVNGNANGGAKGHADGAPASSTLGLQPPAAASASAGAPSQERARFVQRLGHSAERVARDSGIPAGFMLGQAGHETGWGQSEIKHADGSNTFNLFGLKAGQGWAGKVAEVRTTEYVDGRPRKVLAKFRAYDSYEESLRDYARLINGSPRYAKARAQTGSVVAYATALQKAGYATDPGYARKLSGAIHSALRAQRTQT
ncbi:flagellar assembly peptidoglycan hydrolase FlgJ [Verminephrobacter eiseniae]|uniref:flagellar assembly peptidoglycan hydrolase FlgJ n=1 Tax=Verminephrobacter eiseniae TaxID=364317 RepID=UPI00223741DB|nr:flagellar assembly peptidoglycan hydrolase FlgJ [Verminephrobacter eiseniae]MCW5261538.1 flagellar assembly peptidoglycan hydrolase FlgJ [Verminephrobacter eiseniae]